MINNILYKILNHPRMCALKRALKKDQKMLSWKENAQTVRELIKRVSDKYGGDDPDWLDSYFHEVIMQNSTSLETVVAALEDML